MNTEHWTKTNWILSPWKIASADDYYYSCWISLNWISLALCERVAFSMNNFERKKYGFYDVIVRRNGIVLRTIDIFVRNVYIHLWVCKWETRSHSYERKFIFIDDLNGAKNRIGCCCCCCFWMFSRACSLHSKFTENKKKKIIQIHSLFSTWRSDQTSNEN